ncbi:MAG: 3-deoxy-manno-octulosonate cytidylyltransferase [candidate division Zixibacteria bacterium]|nr:3-deoxy-manno-octulosonate cytidylyltransferase [candidate division Zixibacteria bacterium]
MSPRVVAIIPARMGSSRFAGKVLAVHEDRPLLYHVWRCVCRCRTVDRVMIATDSAKIATVATDFGAEVVRTSKRPRTGSDRVAEAIRKRSASIVINVQADCFGLPPKTIDRVVDAMTEDQTIKYATLARRIESDQDLFDPGVVKVVTDREGRALWFSRFPLPYLQQAAAGSRNSQFRFRGHIGVYFFRRRALEDFARWKQTLLEKAESLEQLRVLEHGGIMQVFNTSARTFSIDTPEDMKKIVKVYK